MFKQRLSRRILFVTTIAATSDAFLEETADQAARQGFEIDLLTNMDEAPVRERPYRFIHNASWGRGFKSPIGTLNSMLQTRNLLKSDTYAIVHTHTPTASAITRLAIATIPKTKRPVIIYTAHGFHFGTELNQISHRIAKLVEKALLKWTNVLIVINNEDETWALGNKPSNTLVLRTNGVGISERFFELGRSTEKRAKSRECLSIDDSEFVALSIGELIPRKRHELALSALAQFNGPRTLIIVGSGPSEAHLTQLASELCSRDPELTIRLEGRQHDIAPYLLAADCLVHPASQEGHPLVILEAMASGLPTVAFEIRGCLDSLQDGRGILVQGSGVDALHNAMGRLTSGNVDVERMVERARMYAEGFRRESLAAETVLIYESFSP